MKPETLDPVIDLRTAITLMLAADERMALLDEQGRIAVINPAWREAARKASPSVAALGRGANFLDLCDDAAAQGEVDSAELAGAIRRVLARESAWARVSLASSRKNGRTATCSASVRRVRGPLENWLLVEYSEARTVTTQPTALAERAVAPVPGAARAAVRAGLETVSSHGSRLDAAA